MEEQEKEIKPKQYSHIDYEALLIYAMKKHISIERAIEENGLTIARSTVTRNIRKMKEEKNGNLDIIEFYQNVYVPNCQKSKLPDSIIKVIDTFPEKEVVIKNELEDLYKKLYTMNEIVEACNGNVAEATRKINSGQTRTWKNKANLCARSKKRYKLFQKSKIINGRKNEKRKRRRRKITWQNFHR